MSENRYRVIAADAAGKVTVLRSYDNSGKALRLYNLATVAGCYDRVQLQELDPAAGWILTAPAVEWNRPASAQREPAGAGARSFPARP